MRSKIVIGSRGSMKYFIEDKEVTREEFRAVSRGWVDGGPPPNTLMQTSKAWPRFSNAMGVDSTQKESAEAYCKKMGVPTEFVIDPKTRTARPRLENSAHQRNLQKMYGYHNNDSGYGQITG